MFTFIVFVYDYLPECVSVYDCVNKNVYWCVFVCSLYELCLGVFSVRCVSVHFVCMWEFRCVCESMVFVCKCVFG